MTTTRKRRNLIIFLGTGLVLVGVVVVAIFWKREPVISVQTDRVTRRNITETVAANGRVQPVLQVKISPEVSGEIIELPVREGQPVQKGDLILKIKPDVYIANRNQADANHKSSLAALATAQASLRKAEADFKRSQRLFADKLVPESEFDQTRAAHDIAKAQLTTAEHQVEMAQARLASAVEELAKTTILSPLTGTISKLNSRVGERVLGMVQNVGTEIMTISDLSQMEARVDVGETDVVLIRAGQKAQLEVDAFKDRKFTGEVTDIANSSKGAGAFGVSASQSQEATKFEVRVRFTENEAFRPGMSVSAEIETRSRTNALAVPLASVTIRVPKPAGTNSVVVADKKTKDAGKPAEMVFVVEGDHAKAVPVKIGICDDSYWEIVAGLAEGQEIVSGGYRAVSRDLEDGKRIRKGAAGGDVLKKSP